MKPEVNSTWDATAAGMAADALYRKHAHALMRFLRHRGPEGQAEDLLQETFARALRRPETLAAARSERAWLFGIARHVAADAWRRVAHERELAEVDWPQPARVPDPRLEDLRRAIGGLSPALQAPLRMRLGEEASYQEIADRLDIPVGTVRSRLHHAMRALRQVLLDQEGKDE